MPHGGDDGRAEWAEPRRDDAEVERVVQRPDTPVGDEYLEEVAVD